MHKQHKAITTEDSDRTQVHGTAAAALACPLLAFAGSERRARRRRRLGNMGPLGIGRSSRSSATFVPICMPSIQSMTAATSLACRRNCWPSILTRITFFRFW